MELRLVDVAVVLAAALGAQRFLLRGFDVWACLIPFGWALAVFRSNAPLRNTLLLMSLFLSVDNGGGGYPETSSLIRYPLYLTCFYALVDEGAFWSRRWFWFAGFFALYALLPFLNADAINARAYYHDAGFALLLGMLWTRADDALSPFRFDLRLLNIFFLTFLGCELANFLLLYSPSSGHYLSYNSTKTLVLFPVMYLIAGGRKLLAALVAVPTMLVLLGYGTRMIPVVFLGTLVLYAAAKLFRGPWAWLKLIASCVAVSWALRAVGWVLSTGSEASYKLLYFAYRLFFEVESLETLRILDPVRFDEHMMIFGRSWPRVLLGDGFGTGLRDVENLMANVRVDQTAFALEELNTGIFYGFHDMWTDIGLRFGMGLVLAVLVWVASQFRKSGSQELSLYALLLFVMINCAFFATAGIIACALLALGLRDAVYRKHTSNLAVARYPA